MALGELQVKPDEFWRLTNGEFMAMLRGYVIRRDLESANHRNLYALMHNINRRKNAGAKQPKDLWPLDIDFNGTMSMDDRLEFYKNIGKNRE